MWCFYNTFLFNFNMSLYCPCYIPVDPGAVGHDSVPGHAQRGTGQRSHQQSAESKEKGQI